MMELFTYGGKESRLIEVDSVQRHISGCSVPHRVSISGIHQQCGAVFYTIC